MTRKEIEAEYARFKGVPAGHELLGLDEKITKEHLIGDGGQFDWSVPKSSCGRTPSTAGLENRIYLIKKLSTTKPEPIWLNPWD